MSLVKKGVSVLTEYMIVIISSFPFIAHPAGFLSTIKLKTADWMAPNKAIIAVLEYLHGYFLPILACIRNQLDHTTVNAIKTMEPMAQSSAFLLEFIVLTWFVMWFVAPK